MEFFNNILIVGYGNIGKHIHAELAGLDIDIRDPYIPEYNNFTANSYNFAFICVPTEMLEDGSTDISQVENAVRYTKASLLIIKSAVPVGTCEMLKNKYGKNIVISPEYYGTTQHSSDSPDFLILGGSKKDCAKVAELYYRVKGGNFKIKFTDYRTAELAKYMENCFLALKVTFCSEFADIASSFGISYPELREIFISDPRMGDSHTFVYSDQPYYNSHCLNKDIPSLIKQAEVAGCNSPLISAMHDINLTRKSGILNE